MEKDVQVQMKKLHETEMEIMDVIHKICVDNNLKYSLAYGSLIGAVRHKGFVPWDDDLDIFMPREDYNKFKELWYKNHHEGFFLQDIDIEEDFTQNFMKIRKDNTLFLQSEDKNLNYHKGIFVDIFPLDRVSNNKFQRVLQYFYCAVNLLLCRKFNSGSKNKVQLTIENTILKLPFKLKVKIRNYTTKKLQKYNKNLELPYFGTSTIKTLDVIFDNKIFENLRLVKYENRNYYIFEAFDDVLIKIYGDYMILPPIEERVWKHKPIKIEFGSDNV